MLSFNFVDLLQLSGCNVGYADKRRIFGKPPGQPDRSLKRRRRLLFCPYDLELTTNNCSTSFSCLCSRLRMELCSSAYGDHFTYSFIVTIILATTSSGNRHVRYRYYQIDHAKNYETTSKCVKVMPRNTVASFFRTRCI